MFKKIAFPFLLVFLLLIAAVFIFAKDIDIHISEGEAQANINNFLALENNGREIRINPKHITIDFHAGNTAQISSVFSISGYTYSGNFDGSFSTGINYRRPKIYLANLALIDGGFTTDKTTQSELDDLKKVSTDIVRRHRERLQAIASENSIIQSNESAENVVNDYILSGSKTFFENIPLYDISKAGKSGFAASLALKKVEFTDTTAIITLNPATALLRILTILGFAFLVMLYLIVSSAPDLILSQFNKKEPEH